MKCVLRDMSYFVSSPYAVMISCPLDKMMTLRIIILLLLSVSVCV